jgi:hypothetical protein
MYMEIGTTVRGGRVSVKLYDKTELEKVIDVLAAYADVAGFDSRDGEVLICCRTLESSIFPISVTECCDKALYYR